MSYEYDYLIVGAGLFGSVFANQITKLGYKCIVIEKRDHIGGNCWSENIEGIDCHKYGPHTFHTDNKDVWDFVNSITKFNSFIIRTKVKIEDKIFSFPINLMTLHHIFGVSTPEEAKEKIREVQEESNNITSVDTWIRSQVGSYIYELFYKGYTEKQWGRSPENITASVAKRIPIRFSFDDSYFSNKYQGIPAEGYQTFFRELLKNIDVRCNIDYYEDKNYWDTIAKKIIFTGKIDEYYDYIYGDLDYRGLKFDIKKYLIEDFQGCPVVNYPDINISYTRTVEYKHFYYTKNINHTIVIYETPFEATRNDVPYYPIKDISNIKRYEKYVELSKQDNSITFCGRVGSYTYNDMDKTVGNALNMIKNKDKFI